MSLKGRALVWLGTSAFSVMVVYYCAMVLVNLMRYLNGFTLM